MLWLLLLHSLFLCKSYVKHVLKYMKKLWGQAPSGPADRETPYSWTSRGGTVRDRWEGNGKGRKGQGTEGWKGREKMNGGKGTGKGGNFPQMMDCIQLCHYPRRLCRSEWVGFWVTLFVCLFVCPQHKNIWSQSVQTWYREWPWDTLEVILFLGFIDQRSRSQGQ